MSRARGEQFSLPELTRARDLVVELLEHDEAYLPIFGRLDREIGNAEELATNDPIARARALLRQRAEPLAA